MRVLALAILVNVAYAAQVTEPSGYRMDHYRAPVPETVQGATVLHTEDLAKRLAAGGLILIDVLPAPEPPKDARAGLPRMPVPHRDIPGSVWLPEVGRGGLDPATESWFRTELHRLTAGRLDNPVVFYCLSECWMSWNATRRAALLGYSHAIWYPEGADGWVKAGHADAVAKPERR